MPNHNVRIIQLDPFANTVTSKTSTSAIPDLQSYDEASSSAYAILFHNEEFVFGTIDKIYNTGLTGRAGFLSSLSHNRKNTFSY